MDILARFVGIMMVFVIYIAVDVGGVAYDGACKADGNCTEANNVCKTSKCACSPTSYKKDGTTKCAAKIALNGACTATPTGQCADSNAACNATSLTCRCKSAHFVNKTRACHPKVPALDGTCDATDSASDQCAVAHSECRTNGTDKCLCKATHYVKGAACTIRKNPNATCGGDECVTHASCVSSKCKCDADYTPSPATSPTMCSGVIKFAALPYMYVVPILVSMMFILDHFKVFVSCDI